LRLGATWPLVFLAAAASAGAQELEPRAYTPNPTGANFVLLAYGRTSGGVFVDPSLPLTDVWQHLWF
jgi:hypothetical protein